MVRTRHAGGRSVLPLLVALLVFTTLYPRPILAQAPAYPAYSVFNTQIRFLYSQNAGRLFKIFVNLPRHYQDEPGRRYPVLYILDPGAHFGMVTDIQRLLEDGRRIEPVVTVGIGYESVVTDTLSKYRQIDMLPTPNEGGLGGGEPQFLRFIADEVFPYIEREYRVNPQRRAIWGGSYGGLFGACVLLQRPELFSDYLLVSPVLAHDHGLLFRYEEEQAKGRSDLSAHVYLAAGGREDEDWMLAPLRRMEQQLRGRHYPGLKLGVEIIESEDHATVGPVGITHGLMRVFARPEPER